MIYGDLKHIDPDGYDEKFEASSGWLFKFVKQHNLLLQREISVAQKYLDLLKLSHILHVRRLRIE